MFVYKPTGAGWVVGFYNPQGDFEEDTSYLEREDAAKRAHYLNGENLEQPKRRVALLKDTWDKENMCFTDGFGTFIQYSTNHVEYETGPGNYPVAIIEKDDGSVEAYDLAKIKFIKEINDERRTDK